MNKDITLAKQNLPQDESFLETYEQFLQIRVGGQLFGIPIVRVRDVFKSQEVTKVPLSVPEILGLMNLRGKVVTVIDMRKRLSINDYKESLKKMIVVVEVDNELYGLQIDEVVGTKELPISSFENNPENMQQNWKEISRGIFKLDKELMLVLSINNIVKF